MTMTDGMHVLVRPAPFTVRALLVMGTGIELELPLDKESFTIGRGGPPLVDVHVPPPVGPLDLISKVHAMLRHVGHKLRVQDLGSKNGSYQDSVLLPLFDVSPGEVFRLADRGFLPLDQQMRVLRRVLARYIGFSAFAAVDEALRAAIAQRPLVFMGASTSEIERLACDIHTNEWRHGWAFVSYESARDLSEGMEMVKKAARGTLFVDLSLARSIPDPVIDAMFSPTFHVRPIVAARDVAQLDGVFKLSARRFHLIDVPDLRRRKDDLPALLTILLSEIGHSFTAESLDKRVLPALRANDWPNNMEGLRIAARNLGALHVERGVNRAAKRLDMAPATISSWLARMGLSGVYKRSWLR